MRRTDTATRIIRAPADVIYRAFLDRDALTVWLPPPGMTARFDAFDPRVGGGYRLTLTYDTPPATGAKSSERSDVVEAQFVELVANERVVQRITFESPDPAFAGVMTMTWSLAPVAGGTEVRIVAEDVPPGISQEDHAAGMRATLENLAAYVES